MSHSFEIVSESVASVEEIHAAFGREDYWLDRLAGDTASTLDSFNVGAEGAIEVRITQHLSRQILPPLMANFVPGDLKLLYRETWRPTVDGQVRGESHVSASGGLGSSCADNWLTPAGTKAQLRSAGKVDVKIPLVGGKIAKMIGASLADGIPATLHYTTTWIAEHA
jgi:hypothetical protein